MRQISIISAAILLLLAVSLSSALAQPASAIVTFQGHLTGVKGKPIPDGEYQVTFSLYPRQASDDQLWSSGPLTVSVNNGVLVHHLGSVTEIPYSMFSTYSYLWLGISIGDDTEMTPRTLLSGVPFAYRAKYADSVLNFDGSVNLKAAGGWTDDGSVVRLNSSSDSVGIGTSSPSEKLDVSGSVYISTKLTVGNGHSNTGSYATALGSGHTTPGVNSFAACANNYVSGSYAAAVNGGNLAAGDYSFCAGFANKARGHNSVVCGGGVGDVAADSNLAKAYYTAVVGGKRNYALGLASIVGGGVKNRANDSMAAVMGGLENVADAKFSFVGGGREDTSKAIYATVLGGHLNLAGDAESDTGAFIGGGTNNSATGKFSTISGGVSFPVK